MQFPLKEIAFVDTVYYVNLDDASLQRTYFYKALLFIKKSIHKTA